VEKYTGPGYNLFVPSARDPEMVYRVFGSRLRALRAQRDLPQEELAALSGLTRASIANIERGRQRVLLHQVIRFAEALQVTVADLIPERSSLTENAKSHTDYLMRLRDQIFNEGRGSEWQK
jgi:transcriptional regulator with XRE-family HTH domain